MPDLRGQLQALVTQKVKNDQTLIQLQKESERLHGAIQYLKNLIKEVAAEEAEKQDSGKKKRKKKKATKQKGKK